MSETIIAALTTAERKELRARAHHLNPVVIIGDAGLTDAVLAEAARAISVHELIKLRVLGDDRELRAALMQRVCEALGCAPVQMIGKLLVVYRAKPKGEASDARDGPHVPKKIAGSGGKARAKTSPRKAAGPGRLKDDRPAAAAARPARATGRAAEGGARTESTALRASRIRFVDADAGRSGSTGRGDASGAKPAARPVAKAVGGRATVWKRIEPAQEGRPTLHKSRASKSTQGTGRPAGRTGARAANPRARTKKR